MSFASSSFFWCSAGFEARNHSGLRRFEDGALGSDKAFHELTNDAAPSASAVDDVMGSTVRLHVVREQHPPEEQRFLS